MAFEKNTAPIEELYEGTVLEGRPLNTIFAPVKSGEEENITVGKAVTIDTNGEVIPYDGTTLSGILLQSVADEIGGVDERPQAEVCTWGYVTVVAKTGETNVLGGGVDFDSNGEAVAGTGDNATFIEEKAENVWLISLRVF